MLVSMNFSVIEQVREIIVIYKFETIAEIWKTYIIPTVNDSLSCHIDRNHGSDFVTDVSARISIRGN